MELENIIYPDTLAGKQAKKAIARLPDGTFDRNIRGECTTTGGWFNQHKWPMRVELYIKEGGDCLDIHAPEEETVFAAHLSAPMSVKFGYGGLTYVLTDYNTKKGEISLLK